MPIRHSLFHINETMELIIQYCKSFTFQPYYSSNTKGFMSFYLVKLPCQITLSICLSGSREHTFVTFVQHLGTET